MHRFCLAVMVTLAFSQVLLADEFMGGVLVIDTKDGSSTSIETPKARTIAGQSFLGGKVITCDSEKRSLNAGNRVWIPVGEIIRIVEFSSKAEFVADRAANSPSQNSTNIDDLVKKIEALGGNVRRLKSLPGEPVVSVDMTSCNSLKDDDLKLIAPLSTLSELYLDGTTVSDQGLKHIAGLKNLTYLGLIGASKITDAGMKELEGLQSLAELRIGNTSISDEGLEHLTKLKSLKMVGVIGTPMTREGLKKFRKAMPNTHHNREDETEGGGVSGGGGGGQRTDPNFDTSIANPSYVDQHPAVMFDEAHNNFHTASGRYKVFANLITNDGYQVTPNTEPITADRLKKYNLLVIANAMNAGAEGMSVFTDDECTSIEEWVKNGGGLLLVTDHEPFGSASVNLAKRFGVRMSLDVVVDPVNDSDHGLLYSRDAHLIGNHPIMSGRNESERVDRVLTFTGQSLKGPVGSVPLLKCSGTATHQSNNTSANGSSQGLALTYGKGRVVVMGEAAQLSAQVYGQPPIPMGMNVPGCDNRKMALNVVHWLSGLLPATLPEAVSKESSQK